MGRVEYKYLLPVQKIEDFRREIAPFVELDQYSARHVDKNYTVRSIYFDTALLDFYQDKIIGLKRRKKIRIRGYNHPLDPVTIFLEIKQKNGSSIVKYRAPVLHKNLSFILHSQDVDQYVLENNDLNKNREHAQRFLAEVSRLNLTPVLKVIYEREAYYDKFNHQVRITIDSNLRSSSTVGVENIFQEENPVYSLINQSILEVKVYGEIPSWLRQAVGRFNLQLQALSKYTICLEDTSNYQHRLQRSLYGLSKYHQFKNFMIVENVD
jgi:SPX domain protein involved in polyphosphate accumulation